MVVENVIVYEVAMREDGSLDVTLSETHQMLLCLMALRGGEIARYDFRLLRKPENPEWEANNVKRFGEPLADHMKRLSSMGLVSMIPILGETDVVTMRLTDTGRNVVTQILEQRGIK